MASLQFICTLLLVTSVLCGNVWGKAIDLLDPVEEKELVTQNLGGVRNSCVYRGKVFTVNVTKIAEKFK